MESLGFAFAVLLVALGLGWPVVARLDGAGALGPGERLLASFLVGAFAIYLAVFAVGPFRLDSLSMGALAAVLAAVAAPGLMRALGPATRAALAAEVRAARADPVARLLWAAVLAIGLASLLQGLAPPNTFDSLNYHLPFPRLDVEEGRIGVPWDRAMKYAFFPALMGNLTRLALVLADARAAQVVHGLFALAAAGGTAALVLRLGFARRVALLGALLFLANRTVVWQMGSVEVDTPLAAFVACELVLYMAWRARPDAATMVLFGLIAGAGAMAKYHGYALVLAFLPVILCDLAKSPRVLPQLLLGLGAATLAVAPHSVRNIVLTGNPVFPLFNRLFNPSEAVFFEDAAADLGLGNGLAALLATPWAASVLPMRHFDGMAFGAPYLIAFAPLTLLAPSRVRGALPLVAVVGAYYAEWFWLLSQQVRFLVPVLAPLAALAAAGLAVGWEALGSRSLRLSYAGIGLAFALIQAMFVGSYALLRLPVALGLTTPAAYHARTPTMTGAFFATCSYVAARLEPGERYLSLLIPHSYYCPQAPASVHYLRGEGDWWLYRAEPPAMGRDEFVRRFAEEDFRFVIVETARENRSNETARPETVTVDLSRHRLGRHLAPALRGLAPLAADPFSAVYDGREVLRRLREGAGARPRPVVLPRLASRTYGPAHAPQ
ncbi:MAG: phospholipid carrier-dependent glycosyltransferase [Proteobacteria bacterium]|nr:phospholipid carrier-dependent glycosyltransferase [Pseudomonadota bacterium]